MTGLAARLGVLVLLAGLAQAGQAGATVYYVDAANGRDETSGLSEREAWRSLARVSRADLRPGDQVLFRRGGTPEGRTRRAQLLRQYCKLDTAAMVMVWKHWLA